MASEAVKLGVCYYPEQWPETMWQHDAARMVALGIGVVRIGEFAWSRIEPRAGEYDWAWLDRIIEILAKAGLQIVLGTPTATPPAWLIRAQPEILAWDQAGQVRQFGSRRHYCFSSCAYRIHCARIVTELARRYGHHPALLGWQTDNEYGCHDSTMSFSPSARAGFGEWLAERYQNIEQLNSAWGNVFWSMEYQDFSQIGLPNLCVTEANPAHWLDFRRFSSDQVLSFNQLQCQILRELSPGRRVTHNMMGFIADFDHFALGQQLDFASWDSYPQGFTQDRMRISDEERSYYLATGHPDVAAFHHDLYRAVGRGHWWVMEQQPGPVNWAPYNPIPAPGMVRLWSWEALAHGAECVCYFRWRQLPFGQEQMHAGLLRSDDQPAPGWHEVAQVAQELLLLRQAGELLAGAQKTDDMAEARGDSIGDTVGAAMVGRARVALVFDYQAEWMVAIQPQGRQASVLHTAFAWYSAVRALGQDVDLLPPGAALDGYQVVLLPCQPVIGAELLASLQATSAAVLFGPRCGSKTDQFMIPPELPPGPLQVRLPFKVTRVGSMPPDWQMRFVWQDEAYVARDWVEQLQFVAEPDADLRAGAGNLIHAFGNWTYLSAAVEPAFVADWVASQLGAPVAQTAASLPRGARWRSRGNLRFALHYGEQSWIPEPPPDARKLFGPDTLQRGDCSCWQVNQPY